MSNLQQLKNIQMLRALAALSVMLFHGAGLFKEAWGEAFWPMSFVGRFGYMGVDLFFVISGFVAAHTSLGRPRHWSGAWRYLCQRFARIFLGYWPFFALSIASAAVFQPALLSQWDMVRSFFLWFLIGLHEGSGLVLFVSWSLSYELLFYGLVALTYTVSAQHMDGALKFASLLLVLVLLGLPPQPEPIALWTFLAFLFEFLLGALLRTQVHKMGAGKGSALLVISISLGLLMGMRGDFSQIADRVLSVGLVCFGLVGLAVAIELKKPDLAPQWLVSLGDSSYSLYLGHAIFWSVLGYLGAGHWLGQLHPVVGGLVFGLLVLSCVGACHIYSKQIEIPLYRWSQSFLSRPAVH